MSEQWLGDYIAFRDWSLANGWEPGLQIDRRDNDDGYHPGNCRFVPKVVNANNTRTNVFLEWGGKRQTVSQWARELGLSQTTLWHRISRGWDLDRAFAQPERGR